MRGKIRIKAGQTWEIAWAPGDVALLLALEDPRKDGMLLCLLLHQDSDGSGVVGEASEWDVGWFTNPNYMLDCRRVA